MGPLAGIKVVEFGRFVAVPFCAQLLSDAGARVVKVEPPSGDPTRGYSPVVPGVGKQFLNKNRGKESFVVDLGAPDGAEAARRLAASADVVIVNFRREAAARLGLDYQSLRKANPRLIYATNSAFGERGPLADAGAFDAILQAYSGIHAAQPWADEVSPSPQLPFVDLMTAALMAFGVTLAVRERERSGEGQEVSTSLLGGALALATNMVTRVDAVDGWQDEFLAALPGYQREGLSWAAIDEKAAALASSRATTAYGCIYRTADGSIMLAGYGMKLQRRLLEILDVYDPMTLDPDWAPADPLPEMERVRSEFATKFRERPTAEWMDLLRAAGIPATVVHHHLEVLADEQVRANGMLWHFDHPQVGASTVVGPVVGMSRTPLEPAFPARALGADTAAVLEELGYGAAEIARMAAAGAVGLA